MLGHRPVHHPISVAGRQPSKRREMTLTALPSAWPIELGSVGICLAHTHLRYLRGLSVSAGRSPSVIGDTPPATCSSITEKCPNAALQRRSRSGHAPDEQINFSTEPGPVAIPFDEAHRGACARDMIAPSARRSTLHESTDSLYPCLEVTA